MNGSEKCIKQNKYNTWYFKLVGVRTDRKPNKQLYVKHHIIPKCIGGSNIKTNLVYLTHREHFVAHRLSSKFTISRGLKYAVFLMFSRHIAQNIIRTNSRSYDTIMSEYKKYVGVNTKERMERLVASGEYVSPFSN